MTTIDRKKRDFAVYYYLQLPDTVKYILNDWFICIIKAQSSDEEESQWKCLKGCQNNVKDELCKINWFGIADTAVAKWTST